MPHDKQRDAAGPASAMGPEEAFFQFLSQGKFMLQRCRATGRHLFYPRVFMQGADAADLEWVEASGMGEVYASTVIHRKPEQGGNYNISIIELAEGPRMMARVLGMDPAAVRIGLKVVCRIELPAWDSAAKTPVAVFYPA